MHEESFPDVLPTPRLSLRPYRLTDGAAVHELVREDRDHLTQSFPEIARELVQIEDSRAFIEEKTGLWRTHKSYCYGIWLGDGATLIGQIQVKNITWNVPSAELAYFIRSTALRRGYASEAVSAVLHLLFGQLAFLRVYIRVIVSNLASLALAESMGFQREGVHRQEFRCGRGQLHDLLYLSIVKNEWGENS
jgi:RimJ/RimL family protein N-acetyltransferase